MTSMSHICVLATQLKVKIGKQCMQDYTVPYANILVKLFEIKPRKEITL